MKLIDEFIGELSEETKKPGKPGRKRNRIAVIAGWLLIVILIGVFLGSSVSITNSDWEIQLKIENLNLSIIQINNGK